MLVVQAPESASLPAGVVEAIIERAEGVPLFLEELTQAVIEKRAGIDEGAPDASASLEIPETLDGVLLARLDRLGPARAIVQIAAALGRTFMHKVIRAAANVTTEELERALEILVESDWVWRQGAASERQYVFRHALLQDAAYHSLPVELRRSLHERLVEAIETQCPEIVAAQPEVIARHCFEAGQPEKSAALWTAAGQLSLAQSGLHEAAAQFERGLAILANIPSTKRGRADQLVAQVGLANALMHIRGYAAPETRAALDQARRYYTRAEELNEPPKDPSILLAVLHGIWVANHVAFDGPAVRELSETFMTLAKNQESIFARAIAHRIMGTSLLFLGDFLGARLHLDRTLALYDPVAHRPLAARFGQDAAVAVLSNRPLALWLLGHLDEAENDAANAISMARNVGHLGSLLYMLTRIAWVKLTCGDYEGADTLIQELSASATDVEGSYWMAAASLLRGCHHALVGDAGAGVELIGAGVAASRTRGAKLLRLPWYFYCLARAHARLGDLNQARVCLDEAFAAATTSQEAWPEAELHRLAGDLALASNEPQTLDARRHFERALAVAGRQHAKSYELRAVISIACLCRDFGGDRSQAVDRLRRACDGFAQGAISPDLKLGRKLLTEFANQPTSV